MHDGANSPDRSLRTDLILSCGGLVALTAIMFAVFAEPAVSASGASIREPMGELLRGTNEVRRRADGTLVWYDLHRGDTVRENDAVYVAQDSTAVLALDDGSRIEIDEGSLVVLRRPTGDLSEETYAVALEIRRGGAQGTTESRGLLIQAGDTSMTVRKGSRASVRVGRDRSARLDVIKGGAELRGGAQGPIRLTAGERRTVDARGAGESSRLAIALGEPAHGAQVFFTEAAPEVRFRWHGVAGVGAYQFELSRDPGFTDLQAKRRCREPVHVQRELFEGVYYWRIRHQGDAGPETSEERMLIVTRDSAPIPYLPVDGATVYLPAGSELLMAWIEVPDVERYQVEISRGETPVARRTVEWSSYTFREHLDEGDYCFRVRSTHRQKSRTPWSETTCFRVIHRPLPRAPRLYRPTIEEVPLDDADEKKEHGLNLWSLFGGVAHAEEPSTKAIVLRWETVPGITAYVIEIAENRAFDKVVVRQRLTQPYFRWRTLTHRPYFWRVKSIDAQGREGEFSDPKLLGAVVGSPALVGPAQSAPVSFGSESPEVRLRWKRSELLAGYLVQVARDPGFSRTVLRKKIQGKPELAFRPEACGRYYWRIIGIDLNGRRTRPSRARHFDVVPAPPELLGSKKAVAWREGLRVRLVWSQGPSTAYQVEVARDPKFRRRALRTRVTKPQHRFRVRKPGVYHWRVRGLAPASDWSRSARLRVVPAPPAHQSPEDGGTTVFSGATAPLELEWSPVPGASAYRVEIGLVGGASLAPVRTERTQAVFEGLAAGRYRWQVVASTAAGLESEPSEAWSFELRRRGLPDAPTLIAPAEGEDIEVRGATAVSLSWSQVDRAASYVVEVSNTKAFAETKDRRTVTRNTASIQVAADQTHFWRVSALNQGGEAGAWSRARSFTLSVPPPPERKPVIVKPPPPPPPSRLGMHIGPRVAYFYNLGEISTVRFGAELGYRLPFWDRRLGLVLSIGYYTASASAESQDGMVPAESRLHAIPIDLLLLYVQPTDVVDPYIGCGLSLDISLATVSVSNHPTLGQTKLEAGFVAAAGVERMLGPGALFIELRYALAPKIRDLVEVDPGGFTLGAGYRFRLW